MNAYKQKTEKIIKSSTESDGLKQKHLENRYKYSYWRCEERADFWENIEISNRSPRICVEHIKRRCTFIKKTYESLT